MTSYRGFTGTGIVLFGMLISACDLRVPIVFPTDSRIVRGDWTGNASRVCYGTNDIAWSPDASKLLVSANRSVIWNATTGAREVKLAGFTMGATWTPDGKQIVGYTSLPLKVTFSNALTGEVVRTLELAVDNTAFTAAISPDASKILVADVSPNPRLRLLNLADGSVIRTFDLSLPGTQARPYNLNIRWSADGSRILGVGTASGPIKVAPIQTQTSPIPDPSFARVWDANTGNTIKSWYDTGYGVPNAVAISPDGQTIALPTLNGVRVAQVASGAERTLKTSGNFIKFSKDSKQLLTATIGLEVWDVASGEKTKTIGAAGGAYVNGIDISDNTLAVARTGFENGWSTCPIELYKSSDSSLTYTLDESKLDKYTLKLNLKATYLSEREYDISGTASVDNTAFIVQGKGYAGADVKFVTQAVAPESTRTELRLLDTSGKNVWTLQGTPGFSDASSTAGKLNGSFGSEVGSVSTSESFGFTLQRTP